MFRGPSSDRLGPRLTERKQMKNPIDTIDILKEFEAVWYFTKYDDGLGKKVGIVYGCKSTDDMDNYFRPVKWRIMSKFQDEKTFNTMTKYIRQCGTKFFTNDADNSDLIRSPNSVEPSVWGYYYSKDCDINFEPLDMETTPDLGHTYLYYFDRKNREYKEL